MDRLLKSRAAQLRHALFHGAYGARRGNHSDRDQPVAKPHRNDATAGRRAIRLTNAIVRQFRGVVWMIDVLAQPRTDFGGNDSSWDDDLGRRTGPLTGPEFAPPVPTRRENDLFHF